MRRYARAVITATLLLCALPAGADNWSDLRGAVYYGKQSDLARLLDRGDGRQALKGRMASPARASDEAQAYASYQQAVAANPELSRLRARIQGGGAEAAIPSLLAYTKANPRSAEAWYLLAVAYGRANQEQAGMSALSQAVRLKPEMNALLDPAMRQRLAATAPSRAISRNGPNDGRTASTRARLEARDAVWYNNPAELTALLDAGLDVNALDESGRETLLHAAAGRDRVEIARLLLARGADKSIADKDGKLPVDQAQSPEMRALLAGARRSTSAPPKADDQHCKAMWQEATALCGIGNSSCNTNAHIRYQGCVQKGTWY